MHAQQTPSETSGHTVTTRAAADAPSSPGRDAPKDAGMTTAEYAVGTIAAVAFAAVLYKIVQSPQVHDMLMHLIESALQFAP